MGLLKARVPLEGEDIAGIRKHDLQRCEHVLLQFHASGESRFAVGRRDVRVQAGQMVLFDLSQPVVCEAQAVSATDVMIPRKLLGDRIATVETLHGQSLDCLSAPALRMFRTYLSGLVNCADTVEPGQALHLSQVVAALCAASFEPVKGDARAADLMIDLEMRRFIESELGNEGFGVETLLSRFDVSRTTLYRHFEGDDGAANYIRERRLLHALRLLTRSGTRPRISAVAYAVGFSDEKTFSRAFRRRFGFLPRDASVGEASPRTRGRDEPVLPSWMKTLTV